MMGADHVARINSRISGGPGGAVNDYLAEKAEQIAAGIPAGRSRTRLDAIRRPRRRCGAVGHPGPTHEKQLLVASSTAKPVLCE